MSIKFYDTEHEKAYNEICKKMSYLDEYHSAVAYLFSLDTVCREHVNELFDFVDDCINPFVLDKPWQTSFSRSTTRLAFNLWNGLCCDDDFNSICNFTVARIFCNIYAPYYVEALKLRFPSYFGIRVSY